MKEKLKRVYPEVEQSSLRGRPEMLLTKTKNPVILGFLVRGSVYLFHSINLSILY